MQESGQWPLGKVCISYYLANLKETYGKTAANIDSSGAEQKGHCGGISFAKVEVPPNGKVRL